MTKDDNEDDLKNKEDLHIGGKHTALDIFRFAVFLNTKLTLPTELVSESGVHPELSDVRNGHATCTCGPVGNLCL